MVALQIGSLFSGVGGLDLGVERATGARVAWHCESDPFCRRVLAKHWPGVPCFDNVIGLEPPPVDLLIGGFPCTDIAVCNTNGKGLDGSRSGLWFEFSRIIRLVRPRIVFVENTRNLAARGLAGVLGDLARLRYHAAWDVLGACCIDAPHRRERMFILATLADGDNAGRAQQRGALAAAAGHAAPERGSYGGAMGAVRLRRTLVQPPPGARQLVPVPASGIGGGHGARSHGSLSAEWPAPPAVGRVVHGVPGPTHRSKRLHALGNAVVPAQAELAFRVLAGRLLPHLPAQ